MIVSSDPRSEVRYRGFAVARVVPLKQGSDSLKINNKKSFKSRKLLWKIAKTWKIAKKRGKLQKTWKIATTKKRGKLFKKSSKIVK